MNAQTHRTPPRVREASSPYLTVEEVAEWLRTSPRAVHELTRSRTIPHMKRPHGRRCLFRIDWLELWHESGCALEVKELAGGGRIVSPKA